MSPFLQYSFRIILLLVNVTLLPLLIYKLYHPCVYVEENTYVYIDLATICSFRHLLRVSGCVLSI